MAPSIDLKLTGVNKTILWVEMKLVTMLNLSSTGLFFALLSCLPISDYLLGTSFDDDVKQHP